MIISMRMKVWMFVVIDFEYIATGFSSKKSTITFSFKYLILLMTILRYNEQLAIYISVKDFSLYFPLKFLSIYSSTCPSRALQLLLIHRCFNHSRYLEHQLKSFIYITYAAVAIPHLISCLFCHNIILFHPSATLNRLYLNRLKNTLT